MLWVKETSGVPIKSWCLNVEAGALVQAYNIAKLPFAFSHVGLMPDTHPGFGMPIGGVLATEGVAIPNAVGSDIGCGMRAVKTDMDVRWATPENIKMLIGEVRDVIPVGHKHQDKPQDHDVFAEAPEIKVVQDQLASARKQLGTLGSGNHFIEIQKGADGYIWFMIHSGSRNLGYRMAKYYHKIAERLCSKWHSNRIHKELSFLPIEFSEAKEYMEVMNFALKFAKANREHMMTELLALAGVEGTGMIDVHHNYAVWENHFKKNVIVHRKGATSAREGELGIIPGSQGTGSYIVRGKGNRDSFNSCSHGAGRTMGRNQAKRELNLEEEQQKLDDLGIIHSVRNIGDLDEAPGAYKDINEVMKAQEDLVDIVVTLSPLGVVKG